MRSIRLLAAVVLASAFLGCAPSKDSGHGNGAGAGPTTAAPTAIPGKPGPATAFSCYYIGKPTTQKWATCAEYPLSVDRAAIEAACTKGSDENKTAVFDANSCTQENFSGSCVTKTGERYRIYFLSQDMAKDYCLKQDATNSFDAGF